MVYRQSGRYSNFVFINDLRAMRLTIFGKFVRITRKVSIRTKYIRGRQFVPGGLNESNIYLSRHRFVGYRGLVCVCEKHLQHKYKQFEQWVRQHDKYFEWKFDEFDEQFNGDDEYGQGFYK